MRKDAKIGFAIGGVLLAVIVVYLVVVPRHRTSPTHTSVTLVTPSGTSPGAEPAPVASGDAGSTPSITSTPNYNEKPAMLPSAAPTAPVSPVTGALPGDVAKPALASNDNGKGDNGNWDKLFPGSTLMSTTGGTDPAARPVNAGAGSTPVVSPVAENTAKPAGGAGAALEEGVTTPRVSPMTNEQVALNAEGATPKQYVVKSGQTLSSIAADVYGNSRFYVAILKANPQLNPNRMRPGTRIALPDISDVKPGGSLASSGAKSTVGSNEPRSLDASGAAGGGVILASEALTQTDSVVTPASGRLYAVQKGDTLFRIAKRLYGDASKEKAIYNMNQDVIGSNPAKLKLGMVLHLPDGASSGS